MAGCSVQAGKQVEPTTGKQQTKETVQETVQETELQKPTHPAPSQIPVSYTHLDVYKRQVIQLSEESRIIEIFPQRGMRIARCV